MPPDAAMVVAVTLALPWSARAIVAVEVVIIPQSMVMLALPVAWIPVLLLSCRLSTQKSPETETPAACAVAVIMGALGRNIELNDSDFLTPSTTLTWFLLLPLLAGKVTVG